MEFLEWDAVELSGALAAGRLSAVEVMQATLARIEAVNGAVNAVVSLRDADDLLAEARAADAAPRQGWLHGIPMAIKDLAHAKGLPTSQGSPLFAGRIAQQDDIAVARLRAAGALIIGKTNTPEFGLGSHTFNPVHGATHNPYDLDRSAGGSSGGAAAALAARMLCLADGSDMMGSLRNPAGWNNVYGMRPTWGTVPGDPAGDLFLHQLSTLGPMARSPRDLAALRDVKRGADPRLPLSAEWADCATGLTGDLPKQRIGWLGDWDGAFPCAPGIIELSEAALQQMAELGHAVAPMAPPFDADAMWESWTTLRSFAVAASLGAIYDDPARREHLKPAAQWEVARGQGFSATDIQRASSIRSNWFRAAMQAFETVDVLVLPSAQVWPFDVGAVHPTEINGSAMDSYHRWMQVVVPASLIGLPVVNIPAGFDARGLPLGLQLIGKRGSDARLLQLAEDWHRATGLPQAFPPKL
ncbi:amidase [Sulfitobacter sp. PS-8MA]|uniref:amidase n=1 Tax=Sulfitobacter sp. PS-8MA TaxID=3237707 RepID=UPI0034C69BF0